MGIIHIKRLGYRFVTLSELRTEHGEPFPWDRL
jgi:hypothetical protein